MENGSVEIDGKMSKNDVKMRKNAGKMRKNAKKMRKNSGKKAYWSDLRNAVTRPVLL